MYTLLYCTLCCAVLCAPQDLVDAVRLVAKLAAGLPHILVPDLMTLSVRPSALVLRRIM
jgi:hypothetical protein